MRSTGPKQVCASVDRRYPFLIIVDFKYGLLSLPCVLPMTTYDPRDLGQKW